MDLDVEDIKGLESAVFFSCWKIYRKYISESAALEINLEWKRRMAMVEIFEKRMALRRSLKNGKDGSFPLSDSLTEIESAVEEISLLMNDSGARFRQLTVFSEVSKESISETNCRCC